MISGIRRGVNEIVAAEVLRSVDRQFVTDVAAPTFKAQAVFSLACLTLEDGSRNVGNELPTYGA